MQLQFNRQRYANNSIYTCQVDAAVVEGRVWSKVQLSDAPSGVAIDANPSTAAIGCGRPCGQDARWISLDTGLECQ